MAKLTRAQYEKWNGQLGGGFKFDMGPSWYWMPDVFERFFNDLKRGVPMVTVIAPAIAASFPTTYLNLNEWFKKQGVSANFDVSFGAELTINGSASRR